MTRKHGADAFFYGSSEDTRADDFITSYENSAQSYIQDVRKLNSGSKLDSDFCSAFITHLEVRSLFLREEFSRLGQRALEKLSSFFADKKTATKMMRSYFRNHPELMDEQLSKAGIPVAQWASIKSFVEVNANDMIDRQLDQLLLPILVSMELLKPQIVEAAKSGHIKGILGGFTESERTANHAKMYFTLESVEDELILPDTGVVFFTSKGVTPLSQKKDILEAVAAPIRKERYILGVRKKGWTTPIDTLNRGLASCAYQSFIASKESPDFRRLQNRIGKSAKLVSDSELKNLIKLSDLLSI